MCNDWLCLMNLKVPLALPLPQWHSPSPYPAIPSAGIDIWRADLAADQLRLKRLAVFCSADERFRCHQMVSHTLRMRCLARRGVLRLVLSRYTKTNPAALVFAYSNCGKPVLLHPNIHLEFNMSDSDHTVMIAVGNLHNIGIDIEQCDGTLEADDIAKTYFSAAESAAVHQLHGTRQTEAFLRSWTAKEACIKAMGTSLTFEALKGLYVPIEHSSVPTVFQVETVPEHTHIFSCLHFTPRRHFVATLALKA